MAFGNVFLPSLSAWHRQHRRNAPERTRRTLCNNTGKYILKKKQQLVLNPQYAVSL